MKKTNFLIVVHNSKTLCILKQRDYVAYEIIIKIIIIINGPDFKFSVMEPKQSYI